MIVDQVTPRLSCPLISGFYIDGSQFAIEHFGGIFVTVTELLTTPNRIPVSQGRTGKRTDLVFVGGR
jgi:hypothetical protein